MTGGNWGRIHEADSDLTSFLARGRFLEAMVIPKTTVIFRIYPGKS
jgi:hypothetical protein